MVPMDLDIGFQGLALIQGQIYNPDQQCLSKNLFYPCLQSEHFILFGQHAADKAEGAGSGNVNRQASGILFGQIIATSHGSLTPNGGLVREIPLFQGNLGWWNIITWPDIIEGLLH